MTPRPRTAPSNTAERRTARRTRPGVRAAAAALACAATLSAACEHERQVLRALGPDADDAGADEAFDLSLGHEHTCAVVRGALYCWGGGADGALGLGAGATRLEPAPVDPGRRWAAVSAGIGATCGRTVDGSVLCWGANGRGQLGVGDFASRGAPTRVPLPVDAVGISSRQTTACAVGSGGTLHCWGENTEGQAGQDDVFPGEDLPAPRLVGGAADWRSVATGSGPVCGVRAPGTLWCWGRNSDGQLGLGQGAPVQRRVPTQVGARDDWAAVAAGQAHVCALDREGRAYCAGADGASQLGDGPGRGDRPTFEPVAGDLRFRALDTGWFHACGIDGEGALWCWGRNVEGQLGTGDVDERAVPTRIGDRRDWAQVSTGRFHTCAAGVAGDVWCTGENDDGELGVGDRDRRRSLTRVALP